MQISTFQLTKHDLDLLHNREFLQRKNQLVHDIVHEFGRLGNTLLLEKHMQWLWQGGEPSCKVTRGEQHKGLPYIVLDIPQLPQGNFMALRVVFWWGYGWSANLLLNGEDTIQSWLNRLDVKPVQPVWVKAGDLWDNDHLAGGYMQIGTVNEMKHFLEKRPAALRLLQYLPIAQHENLPKTIQQLVNDWRPGK